MDKLAEDALQIQSQVEDLITKLDSKPFHEHFTSRDWVSINLQLVKMSIKLKLIASTFKRYASK